MSGPVADVCGHRLRTGKKDGCRRDLDMLYEAAAGL